MAQNRAEIQNRIASVRSTHKITNAMQLVSSSKLARMKASLEKGKEYSQSMAEILALILEKADKNHPFRKVSQLNAGKPAFVFVISSDSGLCGAYNANLFKYAKERIKPDDILCVIGNRGIRWAQNQGYHVEYTLENLNEDIAYMDLSRVMQKALDMYNAHEISAIEVIYTRFVNAITFEPEMETLLPVSTPEIKKERISRQTIFEPGKNRMLETVLPQALKSMLYSKYMESRTSEQASRRTAMESATDNAEELLDNLTLQSNRIRQAAITQEITEIVSGANALAGG